MLLPVAFSAPANSGLRVRRSSWKIQEHFRTTTRLNGGGLDNGSTESRAAAEEVYLAGTSFRVIRSQPFEITRSCLSERVASELPIYVNADSRHLRSTDKMNRDWAMDVSHKSKANEINIRKVHVRVRSGKPMNDIPILNKLRADFNAELQQIGKDLKKILGQPINSSALEPCWTMPLFAGFIGGLPFTPALHSGAAPYSPRSTLIGSQDIDFFLRIDAVVAVRQVIGFVTCAHSVPGIRLPRESEPGRIETNDSRPWEGSIARTQPRHQLSFLAISYPRARAERGEGKGGEGNDYTIRLVPFSLLYTTSYPPSPLSCYPPQRIPSLLNGHYIKAAEVRYVDISVRARPARTEEYNGLLEACTWRLNDCKTPALALTKWNTATLAERLAHSPPTKAKRVQSPAVLHDFRKWESSRTMPLVGGFSRGYPVSPTPSFRRRSIFTSIVLIGTQDLAIVDSAVYCVGEAGLTVVSDPSVQQRSDCRFRPACTQTDAHHVARHSVVLRGLHPSARTLECCKEDVEMCWLQFTSIKQLGCALPVSQRLFEDAGSKVTDFPGAAFSDGGDGVETIFAEVVYLPSRRLLLMRRVYPPDRLFLYSPPPYHQPINNSVQNKPTLALRNTFAIFPASAVGNSVTSVVQSSTGNTGGSRIVCLSRANEDVVPNVSAHIVCLSRTNEDVVPNVSAHIVCLSRANEDVVPNVSAHIVSHCLSRANEDVVPNVSAHIVCLSRTNEDVVPNVSAHIVCLSRANEDVVPNVSAHIVCLSRANEDVVPNVSAHIVCLSRTNEDVVPNVSAHIVCLSRANEDVVPNVSAHIVCLSRTNEDVVPNVSAHIVCLSRANEDVVPNVSAHIVCLSRTNEDVVPNVSAHIVCISRANEDVVPNVSAHIVCLSRPNEDVVPNVSAHIVCLSRANEDVVPNVSAHIVCISRANEDVVPNVSAHIVCLSRTNEDVVPNVSAHIVCLSRANEDVVPNVSAHIVCLSHANEDVVPNVSAHIVCLSRTNEDVVPNVSAHIVCLSRANEDVVPNVSAHIVCISRANEDVVPNVSAHIVCLSRPNEDVVPNVSAHIVCLSRANEDVVPNVSAHIVCISRANEDVVPNVSAHIVCLSRTNEDVVPNVSAHIVCLSRANEDVVPNVSAHIVCLIRANEDVVPNVSAHIVCLSRANEDVVPNVSAHIVCLSRTNEDVVPNVSAHIVCLSRANEDVVPNVSAHIAVVVLTVVRLLQCAPEVGSDIIQPSEYLRMQRFDNRFFLTLQPHTPAIWRHKRCGGVAIASQRLVTCLRVIRPTNRQSVQHATANRRMVMPTSKVQHWNVASDSFEILQIFREILCHKDCCDTTQYL
ncbi:hypothetical protein PR048_018879 [Dryococelus australis]|uniref:Uncharacterized protein n=1 Tax=Dryococelus australis TaxID=614101 RepID=A0ABQ9H225_9NEOP|nr:hypothetical protein PR048_018879 [Dryococelus australis]